MKLLLVESPTKGVTLNKFIIEKIIPENGKEIDYRVM